MSSIAPTLKIIVRQATLNARLITAISILGSKVDLGEDTQQFIDIVKAAMESSNQVVELLDAAVNRLEEESNG